MTSPRFVVASEENRNRRLSVAMTAERLACEVAERFGLRASDLKRRCRGAAFSRPRFVAFWLCRECGLSLSETGSAFGSLHHTSVLHGIRKLEDDAELLKVALTIKEQLKKRELLA